MKIRLLLLFILLPLRAYSDLPPDWSNYKVTSHNGKWSVFLSRDYNEGAEHPWQDTWTLSVYKAFQYPTPGPNQVPVWSRAYNPSGYPEGYLSDDGEIFVYVDFWYHENFPVVKIFREECTIFKNGSFFKLGNNLKKTASHELWLRDGSKTEIVYKSGKPYVKVETVAGDRYVDTNCE